MNHSKGHVIEMAWSYATTWIRGVQAFYYRLVEDGSEDTRFFDSKIARYEVDFNCYLMALRRLERAVGMALKAWGQPSIDLEQALGDFSQRTPFLADVRNTNEHFDDYLNERGRSRNIDSRGMGVLKVTVNGHVIARQGTVIVESVGSVLAGHKGWTIEWLGYTVELAESTKIAEVLYQAFIRWYEALPDPIPG